MIYTMSTPGRELPLLEAAAHIVFLNLETADIAAHPRHRQLRRQFRVAQGLAVRKWIRHLAWRGIFFGRRDRRQVQKSVLIFDTSIFWLGAFVHLLVEDATSRARIVVSRPAGFGVHGLAELGVTCISLAARGA